MIEGFGTGSAAGREPAPTQAAREQLLLPRDVLSAWGFASCSSTLVKRWWRSCACLSFPSP